MSGLAHLHDVLLKCPSAQGLPVCKMLTLQLQDAQDQLPSDAVHVLIPSVASGWNEDGPVLVWNLAVLQLTPERLWCVSNVLTSLTQHTTTCCFCFSHCCMWFWVKHCKSSFGVLEAACGMCQVVFSVFRLLKVFAVPLSILTCKEKSSPAKSFGERYLWMKMF